MNKISVMCSGGADSMFLLNKIVNENYNEIHVLHVNHGISNNADEWENIVKNHVNDLSIKNQNKKIYFNSKKLNLRKKNLSVSETNCRKLRYDWVYEYCQKNNIEYVATGHHNDDLLETNFISIFKNRTQDFTLIENKKTINNHQIYFLKPLLEYKKQYIVNFCINNNIPFVHDESNEVSDNVRNVIRNELIPNIKNLKDSEQYFIASESFFSHYQQINDFYNFQIKKTLNSATKIEKKSKENVKITLRYEINKEDLYDNYFIVSLMKYFMLVEDNQNMSKKMFDELMSKMEKLKNGKQKFQLTKNISFRFNNESQNLYIFKDESNKTYE